MYTMVMYITMLDDRKRVVSSPGDLDIGIQDKKVITNIEHVECPARVLAVYLIAISASMVVHAATKDLTPCCASS